MGSVAHEILLKLPQEHDDNARRLER